MIDLLKNIENNYTIRLYDRKYKRITMAKIIDKRKIIREEKATKVLVASY